MAMAVLAEKAAKMARKKLGTSGRCLVFQSYMYIVHACACCVWHLRIVDVMYVCDHLRKLLRALSSGINAEDVKKNGQICPGGDLRVKGNRWLHKALKEASLPRILREGKLRMVLAVLNHELKLCQNLSC